MSDLPKNYWWGNVNGVNYLTLQRNQHIPVYCGSCWAFAATSALSDRIKINRKAQWPDILLAPQVLISCEYPEKGCHGGDHKAAYQWIYNNNITD
jgi:cathepsin X